MLILRIRKKKMFCSGNFWPILQIRSQQPPDFLRQTARSELRNSYTCSYAEHIFSTKNTTYHSSFLTSPILAYSIIGFVCIASFKGRSFQLCSNIVNVHKICAAIFNMKPKECTLDNKVVSMRNAVHVDYLHVNITSIYNCYHSRVWVRNRIFCLTTMINLIMSLGYFVRMF